MIRSPIRWPTSGYRRRTSDEPTRSGGSAVEGCAWVVGVGSMSTNTGIEWTDALLFYPMPFLVAGAAKSYYVEPVVRGISEMVMVLLCRITAIKTRQARYLCEPPFLYGIPNGIRSGLLFLQVLWSSRTAPPHSNAATRNTSRGPAIISTHIGIIVLNRLPFSTTSAVLESHRYFRKIALNRNPNFFSCNFKRSGSCLCHN